MNRSLDLKAAVAAAQHQPGMTLTFAELCNAYNAVHTDSADFHLRKWRDAIGDLDAWRVTTEQLDAAAQAMHHAGYAGSTINRNLAQLGTLYKWAKQQRLTPRGFRSPTIACGRFTTKIRRIELPREDLDRLLARSLATRNRTFGAFVHLLVDTGCRKSEILNRYWREVDLDAGTITCHTTKTGKPRILHFRQETANLMRRVWKHMPPDRLVFEGRLPGLPIDFQRPWETITRQLGLEWLRIHDLRHVAAAELLRSGVSLPIAAQVLGHSPQVLAERYGHLADADLRAAQVQRWEAAA